MIQFWSDWPKVYQRIFWIITGIFLFTLTFSWFSYFREPAPALTWQYIEEQDLKEIPVHHFQLGNFDLTVHADNYLIFERLLGNPLQPDLLSSSLFIAVLVVAMVMMLSVVTTLSRFWYMAGSGLFILFIASLRFEITQVFDWSNKAFTVIALLAYVPVSYFFNAIRSDIRFTLRVITFGAITLALALLIFFFSGVPKPFLHLSVTAIVPAIILTVLFILMVAHEILAAFITMISSGTRPAKSLNHFLIVSFIYLVNLALAYAHRFHYIEWNFLYVNLLLLFTISAVLGIWGFRQRQPQYEGIIEAEPFGLYLFISMGAIAFATISYFTANANDPGLETINDVIIFSHLGYGVIFVVYAIANFFDTLGHNLPVFKVLYKPARMPYFSFRLGGLIATLGLLFFNTWQVPVRNAYSAYYNAGGDLYRTLGNTKLAYGFYERAGDYGFLNHHSNYAIANIEGERQNPEKERNYYKRATERRPTDMAFLNYSQTQQREKKWLESLLILNDGLEQLPDNAPLRNTQGLVYAKLHLLDSAILSLQRAQSSGLAGNAAKTNIIALAALNNFKIGSDSLYKMLGSTQEGVKANALAFANQKGEKIKMDIDVEKDTILNLFSATLISNYLINHLGELDSSLITKVIRQGERKSNSDYSEALLFASALALYEDGQIGLAFQQLEKVIFYSNNQGKYNNLLALWSLEQGEPQIAIPYLHFALNQNFEKALQTTAIATAEAGNPAGSVILWDSLRHSGDSTVRQISDAMIRSLATESHLASKLNDEDKYNYCRYRIPAEDTVQLFRIANSIQNENYRAKAIFDHSKKLYALDETDAAISVFQKLKGLKISDKAFYEDLTHFELLMLAKKGDFRTLATQINKGVSFEGKFRNEKIYFAALISEASGDTILAGKNFKYLARANPFFDDAIVASAAYFSKHSKEKFGTYNILVDAAQRHPGSVKILKAYCREAARLGFDEFMRDALKRLQTMMNAKSFQQFVVENNKVLASSSN